MLSRSLHLHHKSFKGLDPLVQRTFLLKTLDFSYVSKIPSETFYLLKIKMECPKPITIHSFVAFYGEAEITAVTQPLGRHTVTTDTHITLEYLPWFVLSYVIITASLNLFVYKCICDTFVMIAFNVARFLPGTISSNGFSKSIMATKNPWTQKFHQSPRHHRLKISSTISAIY